MAKIKPTNDKPDVDDAAKELEAEKARLAAEESEIVEEERLPDDASLALQKQLDALKKSEESHRLRADNAVKDREVALARAREREVLVSRFQKEAQESQFDAIGSALAAASAEAEKAQLDIENAISIGDPKAQADAYRRLARAETNMAKLEDGKSEIEAARKLEPTRTAEVVTEPVKKSDLPETARAWLTLHPEYLSDQRKNAKIQSLHWEVIDEGHAPFSNEYFNALEEHLGLRQRVEREDQEERSQQNSQRSSIMSAPVSREVPNANQQRNSGQIRLTAAQREAAKNAGVTEKVYAEQLQKLNDMKAAGTYGDRQ